jgi:MFS family permease
MSTVETSVVPWKDEMEKGWPTLLTSLICVGLGAASLLFYSIGVFFGPFQNEFCWNRGQISGAFIYLTLGFVISGPILGWLIDRYGARVVALASIPLLSLSMIGLANMGNSLAGFYGLFFCAACFGGGTAPIVYTRVVNGQFAAARGMALGIILAGTGIAAFVLPPFLAVIIGSYGWRNGFVALAVLAVTAWPLVYFGFRGADESAPELTPGTVQGVDRGDAIKSREFWTICLAFLAVGMAISGLVVHMVPLLRDSGLSLPQAARIASLIGVGVIIGRILIGWVIDRVFAPIIAALVFLVTASGCILLNIGGAPTAPVAAFLVGFAFGAEIDLIAYLTARYFGMRNYGFLYGIAYSMFSIGAAVGPAAVGHLFDVNGNYRSALFSMAVCLAFGAIAMLTLPRFGRELNRRA